jgi:preprotein translocase subunit SecB
VTQAGGFPPLLMDPVDFTQIYRQNLAAMQAQNAAGATPTIPPKAN